MKIYAKVSKYVLMLFLFHNSNFLISSPVVAIESYSEIRGKVLNIETREAVPYSSISIKNASIGTCSNSRGEFVFHYPDSLKSCDLTISSIGYKVKLIKLGSFISNEIANIYLEPEIYEIPEINISPNTPTAIDIVKLVIKNMHKNYSRSPYYMEGFLRDKCFNLIDNASTRLTEAAVEIRKKEFGNETNADRAKVIEIRNSYNYSTLGSLWKEKLTRAFWGYSANNPLYNVLQYKEFANSKELKELFKNELYSTSIKGYTVFDGNPIIIIDIKEMYVKYLLQKIPATTMYNLVRLYIDTENYAMLKTENYTIAKFPKEKLPKDYKRYFKNDTILNFAIKQYEKINGKYFLKYAGYFGRVHDQPDMTEVGKTLYFNETELLVNKVITDKKDFDRIKHQDLLEKETPLWNMKYVYNTSFWKDYNIIIDKPLDSTVQKDLEKEVPLYDQFIDAGVKNSTK
jgi:hypothetical protein